MDKERVKAFADKVFADMAGAMSVGLGFVGVKTGLFRAMSGRGPMTLDQVIRASELQPRYVDEWLQGMACAGYLEHDPAAATYRLPDECAYLVASEGSDHFMGGLLRFAPVLLRVAPRVAQAFEKGGGVPFEDYGTDGIEALDWINRGQYEHRFAAHWLKSLPEVVERLDTGGRVLDVGCGVGRVALAIAKAFPRASVVGLDTDSESISQARAAAKAEGLDERTRFLAGTTDQLASDAQFDLITACDCVHDLAAPLETLRDLRTLLRAGGTLLVIEPKVSDRLEDNYNPIGVMYYGFSVFHCMTQSLARGGAGLGTCMGPARLRALARDAGFTQFDALDIKSQVLAFYAVRV